MVSPSRLFRLLAPLILLSAAGYVVAVLIQLVPLSALNPVKFRIQYATAPYLTQSWSFFAPYIPRESRVANLHIRFETDGEVRELGPLPIRTTLGADNPLGLYGQSRAVCLTTLFEFNLWNPRGPWLGVYERLLSGAAAGINRRRGLGRILAVRGTIMSRHIPAPREPDTTREHLALNTGWLPYHADVEPW